MEEEYIRRGRRKRDYSQENLLEPTEHRIKKIIRPISSLILATGFLGASIFGSYLVVSKYDNNRVKPKEEQKLESNKTLKFYDNNSEQLKRDKKGIWV